MSKVLATDVHVHRGLNDVVVLQAGTPVPAWARDHITNPAAFVDAPEPAAPEASEATSDNATAPTGDSYDGMKKAELVELAKQREVSAKGNKAELIAALRAADEKPAEPENTGEEEEVDLFALPLDKLREIATEKGIQFTDETSEVELATILSDD